MRIIISVRWLSCSVSSSSAISGVCVKIQSEVEALFTLLTRPDFHIRVFEGIEEPFKAVPVDTLVRVLSSW